MNVTESSADARSFLGQMDKPDVDFIREGSSPADVDRLRLSNRNLRLAGRHHGRRYESPAVAAWRAQRTLHCPICGERIARQTPQQIVDQVLAMPEDTRFQVLAPVVRTRNGELVDLFDKLNTQATAGFGRRRGSFLTGPTSEN